MIRSTLALAALLASPLAAAQSCPPMSVYTVSGVNAENLPVEDAVKILFSGTAWKANVDAAAGSVRLSYRGVSGPLDQVFSKAIEQAGRASGTPISAVSDPSRCLVTITAIAPVVGTVAGFPAAPAAPLAPSSLPAGMSLSDALSRYIVANGWSLRWLIDEDYVLDAEVPLPAGDFIQAVTWVVQTYQRQGGLEGVVPRFAKGNRVVVIEQMNVRESE